jgi:hypothetical protein
VRELSTDRGLTPFPATPPLEGHCLQRERAFAKYHASPIANEGARVISYPNLAIVVGTYDTKGTYKRQALEHYELFTDTWLYQNIKWQCLPASPT